MNKPKIDSYQFGKIVIDGQVYEKDLLIAPDRVTPDWWRGEGHSLSMTDLETILEARPEVLVIGQGAYGRMLVPAATREELEAAGFEVVVQRTAEACQTYNRLQAARQVAAALHLTC